MIINPANATAQYDASQNLRSVNQAPADSANRATNEAPAKAAGSTDDPAVKTTISQAALETARAAAPPERSDGQKKIAPEPQAQSTVREKPKEDRVNLMV